MKLEVRNLKKTYGTVQALKGLIIHLHREYMVFLVLMEQERVR